MSYNRVAFKNINVMGRIDCSNLSVPYGQEEVAGSQSVGSGRVFYRTGLAVIPKAEHISIGLIV
jgi:hypothetical protein